MFEISFQGAVIGHSALERGDPPMGVAEGDFAPSDSFAAFLASVPSQPENDKDLQRWTGLSLAVPDGALVECQDVVLLRADFGDEVELVVAAIGIPYPLYEQLFPGHVETYYGQSRE